MKKMFSNDILPFLYELTGKEEVIKSNILKFIGIGESTLEHELRDIIHFQTNPTIAPLATDDGIIIRLTAKANSNDALETMLENTKNAIFEKVGEYFVAQDDETIEEVVIGLLKSKNATIAAAESLTGGKFVEKVIAIPGASQGVKGGIVCYDTTVKQAILDVPNEIIVKEGTVSEACAIELAKNVRNKMNATIGVSFTGVAGPDKVEGKEPGTVYIGLSVEGKEDKAYGINFNGDRTMVRNRAVMKGLEIIFGELKIYNA